MAKYFGEVAGDAEGTLLVNCLPTWIWPAPNRLVRDGFARVIRLNLFTDPHQINQVTLFPQRGRCR
jgi:hypothetical protein